MWNLGIPFNRLFAGTLAYLWIFQLFLSIQNTSVEDFLLLLLGYKDFFLLLIFMLLILSYPIGALIHYLSYLFADKFLYKIFVYKQNRNNKERHKEQLRKLSLVCSDRTFNSIELKEQELSILGSCSINFLLISLIFLFEYKLDIFVVFTFAGMFIFFMMVIQKYISWNKYVERVYKNIDFSNEGKDNKHN